MRRRAPRGRYRVKSHGQAREVGGRSLTYKSWQNMLRRGRHQHGVYADVTVCERWASSFEAFFEDMGERPSEAHSLDRIDPDGHYEPGNCRWATWAQQARNKSNVELLTHPDTGEAMCLTDWAKRLGIRKSTLHYRVKRWPLRRALSEPGRPHRGPRQPPSGAPDGST